MSERELKSRLEDIFHSLMNWVRKDKKCGFHSKTLRRQVLDGYHSDHPLPPQICEKFDAPSPTAKRRKAVINDSDDEESFSERNARKQDEATQKRSKEDQTTRSSASATEQTTRPSDEKSSADPPPSSTLT